MLSPSSNYTNSSKKTPDRPLHITCLTIGSRGDVQPYLALCKELKKDGHTCRIATHPEYQEWVEEYGLEFRSIGGDPGDLMVRASYIHLGSQCSCLTSIVMYLETLY